MPTVITITNISATARAAVALAKERATTKLAPNDVFALVYVSMFVNPDGTTVEGFRPGYMAGPMPTKYVGARWAIAHLPDGATFHFFPRFEWRADERYVLDTVGPLFSIAPAA